MGAVVVMRRGDHTIGGLLCAVALVSSLFTVAGQYVLADYAGFLGAGDGLEALVYGGVLSSPSSAAISAPLTPYVLLDPLVAARKL